MSKFFKRVYQCQDGSLFKDMVDAWDYEYKAHYPNILMFDKEGKRTESIRTATDFIVNTPDEAELVDDFLYSKRNAIVCYPENAKTHSWITPEPYEYDYRLYNPQQYNNENLRDRDEIYGRVREGSDLWKEIKGQ